LDVVKKFVPFIKNLFLFTLFPELETAIAKEVNPLAHAQFLQLAELTFSCLHHRQDFASIELFLKTVLLQRQDPILGKAIKTSLSKILAIPAFSKLPKEIHCQDFPKRVFIQNFFKQIGNLANSLLWQSIKEAPLPERKTLSMLFRESNDAKEIQKYLHSELNKLGNPNTIESLCEVIDTLTETPEEFYEPLLSHAQEKIQDWVLERISKLERQKAIPLLIQILQQKKSERITIKIILTLRDIKCTEAVEPMIKILEQSENTKIQRTLIRALGSIQDKRCLPSILNIANKRSLFRMSPEEKELQMFAKESLNYFKQKDIQEALDTMVKNQESTSAFITRKIKKIIGKEE
jgi:hypothetical protein